jgi:hypothetical protein
LELPCDNQNNKEHSLWEDMTLELSHDQSDDREAIRNHQKNMAELCETIRRHNKAV